MATIQIDYSFTLTLDGEHGAARALGLHDATPAAIRDAVREGMQREGKAWLAIQIRKGLAGHSQHQSDTAIQAF